MSRSASPQATQTSQASEDWAFSLWVGVAALIPRLYVAIAWAREPVWDGHYYDFGARRIAQGLGYSDDVLIDGLRRWHPWCHYPVGYSGFLAGVYKIFGDGPHVATITNAVLGALIVVLTHRLARRFLCPWRARIAALLCALLPALIIYSGLVMTELLSAFLPMLSLFLAVRDQKEKPIRGMLLGGAVMGLATLVHPQNILLAPALAVAVPLSALDFRTVRLFLLRASVATAAAFVVVFPWTLRNCRVMDGCAFVSTNGGWNLAIGSFSRATGRFETLRSTDGCTVVTGQVQQDRCWMQLGTKAIKDDPIRFLKLAPKKLGHSFDHESFAVEYLREADPRAWPESRRVAWREIMTLAHRLLLSLAAFGVVSFGWKRRQDALVEIPMLTMITCVVVYAWTAKEPSFWPIAVLTFLVALIPRPSAPRRDPVFWFTAIVLGAFIAVHVVFFGEDRYHVPLLPWLCLLAAGALRKPAPKQI